MEKELSLQILEYINNNTINHNQIDLIPHFKSNLVTLGERADFKNVIRQLKKDGLIITGTSYVMIAVQGPPNGSVLIPLNSLEIHASITIKGQAFLRELNPIPSVNISHSQNTIVGNQNYQSLSANDLAKNSPAAIPAKKMDMYKNIGIVKWIWSVIGASLAAAIIYWLTKK